MDNFVDIGIYKPTSAWLTTAAERVVEGAKLFILDNVYIHYVTLEKPSA